MKNKLQKSKSAFLRNLAAAGALGTALTGSASAALTTTDLTAGIAGAVTTAEGLIIAGFAVTGLFIVVKIIKKAAARIG